MIRGFRASVEAAFDKMAGVWTAFGAWDALRTRIWETEGHVFTAEMQTVAFDWMDTVFGQDAL